MLSEERDTQAAINRKSSRRGPALPRKGRKRYPSAGLSLHFYAT